MKKLFQYGLLTLAAMALAVPSAAQKAKAQKKSKKEKADLVIPFVELKTAADSTAYLFGVSQSNGLMSYATGQLRVDTAYITRFAQGIIDRANADNTDAGLHAYNEGLKIGDQIGQMTEQMGRDYFAADPDSKMDRRIVASAIVQGLLGMGSLPADSAMLLFRDIMTKREAENNDRLYGQNIKEGETFLNNNKQKEGVITLPSGLQYKVITQGTGPIPTATDRVSVNYEGHLINGTEFDSSYKRNQPATFGVTQVIKGWTEALQKMPVGSKWELYIPHNLAYGERKTGNIPPYSTLIFTVELLEIVAPAATPANAAAAKPATTPTAAAKK